MTPAAIDTESPTAHRYRHNRATKLFVLPIGGKAAGIAKRSTNPRRNADFRSVSAGLDTKQISDAIQTKMLDVPCACAFVEAI